MKASLIVSILVLASTARADIITVNFSGFWDSDIGAIRAGDSFSGSATWNTDDYTMSDTDLWTSFRVPVSVSTFPSLTSGWAYYKQGSGVQPWITAQVMGLSGAISCDPDAVYGSGVQYFLVEFYPAGGRLICHDGEPYNEIALSAPDGYSITLVDEAVARSSLLSDVFDESAAGMDETAETAETPEPYFGLLVGLCLVTLAVRARMRRSNRKQGRMDRY